MHIRNNIINYLCDEDYAICFYDNRVYIYKYDKINMVRNDEIVVEITGSLYITIRGENLSFNKVTKKELLITGEIYSIEKKELK